MGQGVETVLGFLSNAASTGAQAMTAGSGQTFTIRATANGSAPVTLEALFTDFQDAGDARVRSPRMHDDVNGIRVAAPAGVAEVGLNEGFQNPLYSQDTLTVEGYFTSAPTAGHISIIGMQVYYNDVPGIAANNRSWAEVLPNIVQYLVVPVSPTGSTTAGQWGTGVAINSTVDVFKANTLYALIGYVTTAVNGLWAIQGVDTGNLLVGGPMGNSIIDQRRFFVWMDQVSGKPSIPVINSQNKATTLVQCAGQAASATPEISLCFAQLSA
jgi:hypothetical protein